MAVTLTVKNVPDDMLERLRVRAKRNHRSLQGELMSIIEAATGEQMLTLLEADLQLKALGVKTRGDSTHLVREMRDAR